MRPEMPQFQPRDPVSLDEVLVIDQEARHTAMQLLPASA